MVQVQACPLLAGGATAATAGGAAGWVLDGGSSVVLGPESYDAELAVAPDGRVRWTAGGLLRKQFTTSAPVLKACWCHFQNTGPDRILCLLHDEALAVHTQDGDSHSIPLPGRFTGIWPLPQGLLLTGAPGQAPCILVHPLENIQQLVAAGEGGAWGEGEAVVWSSLEVPYLLTYNQAQRRIALWSVGTQHAQGFVAVTPMQWPGTPKTPATQGPGQLHTPLSRGGPPGSATGGYKKPSLRLPNGALSPLAFQPVPRPATPAVQPAGAGGEAPLLLPSQEVPVHFGLIWEQRVAVGGGAPEEGHLVTDDDGSLLLCLLSRAVQRVTALRLPTSPAQKGIEVAFSLPALAVAAVSATFRSSQPSAGAPPQPPGVSALPPRDLLVLHPDGRLALFVGSTQVCTLALPAPGGGSSGGAAGGSGGGGSPEASGGGQAAGGPYARLLGLREHTQGPGSGAGEAGAGVARVRDRLDSSQLSSMRRPSSGGGEVQFDGMALGSEADSDEEMAPAQPSPPVPTSPAVTAAAPLQQLSTPRAGAHDTLPDVGALADALREPLEPVALQGAVGNRVTVVGRDGAALRICLPFAPASQLVMLALDALRAALPADVWWALYGQCLSASGGCSGCADKEWAALSSVLLAWAHDPAVLEQYATAPHFSTATTSSDPSASTGLLSPSGSTPISGTPGGKAWAQLLASDCHKSLLAGRHFQWAAGLSTGAAHQPAVQQAPQQPGSREHAWRALQALHSVYEDCKMSVLNWRLLVPLGGLLAELAEVAGAAAYVDHYARDLGTPRPPAPAASGSDGIAAAQQQPSAYANERPPDMFKALQALLRGAHDGGGWVPPLVAARAPPVQRSANLLAAYLVLAEVAAACSGLQAQAAAGGGGAQQDLSQLWATLEGGAQRLVLELVRRHWTLAELDCLPFGVALPLRQALHQCRNNPPGDWPREAYVLVGRNDIAAGMAASAEHDKPEAVGSAIVSTPLGKMAKIASPSKKHHFLPHLTMPGTLPAAPTPPAAGTTPAQGRLGGAALFTPGLASVGQAALGGIGMPPPPPPSELLWPPEGCTSRLAGQLELQPLPYTQRVLVTGALSSTGQLPPAAEAPASADPGQGDGMENLTAAAARLRFGRDLRLLEVRNLLRSSAPVALRVGSAPEAMDAEGAQLQQIKLTTLAVRTMALPLGRGALTLGTLHPLPTEPLHIPTLCMAGRLPEQNNAVVNLDLSAAPPAPGGGAFCDYTAWPEFHNGVAAGLRLAPSGAQLTRTWIVYNKPEEPSYTHAGLLMALGLTGHLGCLAATDLYRYLSQEHDATIIGVLLGMAAAKRGSLDGGTSRMLFLHLPTRHPSSYPELEISAQVQAAAVLGVGLLFQGSCHRLMAEVMLEEIGRRPGAASKQEPEPPAGPVNLHQGVSQDREGYALAAGMALGLITLGRGRSALGLADLHMEERLRYFMLGGSEWGTVASQRGLAAVAGQGSAAGEGVFGPGVIGFDPTLGEPQRRFVSPTRDSSSGRSGGTVAEELAAAQGSSQVVLEGELVNLDVTSPAATLALGLMYLQTNDAAIARLFVVPETHFALDFVRPEHLQLRVLMRSLVMWDSVAPSHVWVQAQLPPLLKGPLTKILQQRVDEERPPQQQVDVEALAQAHCHLVSGACLAVGIRFAGSCNAQALALLRRYLLYFVQAKQGLPEPGAGAAGPLTRDVLEGCVGAVALALAVVMAGSGHLETFKLLRGLRKRVASATTANAAHPSLGSPPTSSYTYGAHMAVSLGLGFLFMGAGALTFATSPQAVAALVISLFPRFPTSTTDNRYHLQAFRHLYVMAAQPRSVDAVDVDSHRPVYVPLEIALEIALAPATPGGGVAAPAAEGGAGARAPAAASLQPVASVNKGTGDVLAQYAAAASPAGAVTFDRVAPCLLPEREQVASVRVKGPRYWPQLLRAVGRDGSLEALYKTQTLFVQRKAGALPYADDPTGVRSLLSRMFHGSGAGEGGFDLVNLCATFGSDPFITSFAQVFCTKHALPAAAEFESQLPLAAAGLADLCRGALYESITREKPSALLPYLQLWCWSQGLSGASIPADLAAGLPPAVPLWGLQLARSYYASSLGLGAQALLVAVQQNSPGPDSGALEQWEPLLDPLFLEVCWMRLWGAWKAAGATNAALRDYVCDGRMPDGEGGGLLGAFLQLCVVPSLAQLRAVLRQAQAALGALRPAATSSENAGAAMIAEACRGMPLEAAHAIVAAAVHFAEGE